MLIGGRIGISIGGSELVVRAPFQRNSSPSDDNPDTTVQSATPQPGNRGAGPGKRKWIPTTMPSDHIGSIIRPWMFWHTVFGEDCSSERRASGSGVGPFC